MSIELKIDEASNYEEGGDVELLAENNEASSFRVKTTTPIVNSKILENDNLWRVKGAVSTMGQTSVIPITEIRRSMDSGSFSAQGLSRKQNELRSSKMKFNRKQANLQ